jgi:transposase
MLYEFELVHTAAVAARNICAALGEGTVAKRTCQFWFNRFRSGDKSLEDQPRSGRPVECDIEALLALVEDNPRITTRELAMELGCYHFTIEYHLEQLGKVSKLGTWIPHELTPANKQQRVTICNSFLSRETSRRLSGRSSLATRNGYSTSTIRASANDRIATNSRIQLQKMTLIRRR